MCRIAASLGYENRTQFYKIFEREYQMTPTEYREKAHAKR
ncbi:MAG: AraC family transcriptional regulator [Oscillospiraceae bacterium]|nr:AraC family transcriptional regulator [Oscillospiraceae bacterium]